MDLEPKVQWRRVVLIIGVLSVLGMWGMAMAGNPLLFVSQGSAFSTPEVLVLWVVLGVANILFFLSFYGSKPDIFLLLVPIGVMINSVGSAAMAAFGLPFYMDTVGSMLVGIVGGPALGALTAGLTSMMWGVYSPDVLPHVMAAIFATLIVSVAAKGKHLTTLERVMGTGAVAGLVAAGVSWLTVLMVLNGGSAIGAFSLMRFFELLHFSEPVALLLQSFISDPIDKTFSLIVAALAVRFGPEAIRKIFTARENELVLDLILRRPCELDVEDAPAPSAPRRTGSAAAGKPMAASKSSPKLSSSKPGPAMRAPATPKPRLRTQPPEGKHRK
ncbi:hypothetical protein CPHO_07775 [Corynebacterium phocae]|uniref:ECF transporter S component n=1 Tax=Corynebacterium phocae TaxID=161895 RepID=A0A1L7D3U2_9CORY|nr:hypothetical protein [Corynebacterium phocae]APT92804.1 hypothetical protein CPHO_07775 [Corynebacterium phocae]KAA8723117.1 hypothetical protein F4V58_07275 [Corynebacterium phocae]